MTCRLESRGHCPPTSPTPPTPSLRLRSACTPGLSSPPCVETSLLRPVYGPPFCSGSLLHIHLQAHQITRDLYLTHHRTFRANMNPTFVSFSHTSSVCFPPQIDRSLEALGWLTHTFHSSLAFFMCITYSRLYPVSGSALTACLS